MQLYDITIAANTTRQLDAPGSYFYYYAGSAGGADSTITLRGLSSGLRLILKPGQAFRLPQGQKETAWVITNYANTATIIGSVLVGDGDVTDNRITGSVEVVDGGKNRSNAGQAFFASTATTSVAAQNPIIQLWNTAGSGKNLIVESTIFTTATSQIVQIGWANTTIAGSSTATSKKTGSGSSTAQLKNGNNAGALAGYSLNFTFGVQANTPTNIKFSEPFIVTPGYGIILFGESVNTDIRGGFEFFEESAT